MFKYKSVYYISIIAEDIDQRGFGYGTSEEGFRWAESKGMTVPHPEYVSFGKERKSLPTNTSIKLIRLNYPLDQDRKHGRTKFILEEALKGMQLPAKIYIDAHSSYNSMTISQEYHSLGDSKGRYIDIGTFNLANFFADTVREKHSITFHFLSCSGISFARRFLSDLLKKGFSNCFAIGYTDDVAINTTSYSQPQQFYEITDFSTTNRTRQASQPTVENPNPSPLTDYEQKYYLHHSDDSSLPDNKFIAFYNAGTVTEKPYRRWLEEHTVRYGIDRKNLFDYNFIAILLETGLFFKNQVVVNRHEGIRQLLNCYHNMIDYFLHSQEGSTFDPQKVLTFFKGILYSVDLWTLHKENPSSSLKGIIDKFLSNYNKFKEELLVIVPAEASQLSLDLQFIYTPPGRFSMKKKPITVMNLDDIPGLVEQISLERVLDFRLKIH